MVFAQVCIVAKPRRNHVETIIGKKLARRNAISRFYLWLSIILDGGSEIA